MALEHLGLQDIDYKCMKFICSHMEIHADELYEYGADYAGVSGEGWSAIIVEIDSLIHFLSSLKPNGELTEEALQQAEETADTLLDIIDLAHKQIEIEEKQRLFDAVCASGFSSFTLRRDDSISQKVH